MDLSKIKLKDFPILPFVQLIWRSRPDLQREFLFPDTYEKGQREFIEWFIENGPREYNFDESTLVNVCKELKKDKMKELVRSLNGKTKKVNRMIEEIMKKDIRKSHCKKGVNLFAFIRGDFGLGEASRGTAANLMSAGVDFNIIDLYADYVLHQNTNTDWEHKITDKVKYDISIFHCNPSEFTNRSATKNILKSRYNIGYWVWELPEFPEIWVPFFRLFDEIWTPSSFSADAIGAKAFCPVLKIPHSIEVKTDKKLNREYFGLPDDKFLFMFMYDSVSWIERKNPQATIEAFKRAFKNNENVGLVIKVSNSKHGRKDIEQLEDLRKAYKNIYIIDQVLPKIEVNSLLDCCDVFVSLHRSEGFGLGLAEAMYLGKPVIGTGWSGNTDFMRYNNSCMVKYNLVPVEVNYANVDCANQYWAEADVDEAAKYMYKLYYDKAYYKEIAHRGQQTILEEFSVEAVGKIINNRIKRIRK